jgi:midasin
MIGLWNETLSRPAEFSQSFSKNGIRAFRRNIDWLLPMVDVLSKILSAQQKLSGLQPLAVLDELQDLSKVIEKCRSSLLLMPDFQAEMVLETETEILRAGQEAITAFQSKLILWTSHDSTFSPLLNLLVPWLENGAREVIGEHQPIVLKKSQASECSSVNTLSKITSVVNSILASVQAIEGCWKDSPFPGERHGWIPAQGKTYKHVLQVLNLPSIVEGIEQCFNALAGTNKAERSMISYVLIFLQPIMTTYNQIVCDHLANFIDFHQSLCRLSHELTKSFVELGTRGFCTPPDKSTDEAAAGQEQKLEGGTGLGEGEGAEDISKDIGDDEDLTELAQERDQNKDRDELEDEQDAVDMADEEMEGLMV